MTDAMTNRETRKYMLNDFINKLKIKKGDILLITENSLTLLMTIKRIDKTLNSNVSIDNIFDIFLDKIIEKLGDNGTLLIQTFDWGFCQGKKFDILNSKSKTSFLGNIAIKRDDFIRTKHPIYSFAVTGKYKVELENLNNIGAFDIGSPFHFLYEKRAKMISIDIPIQKSFTFVHYVEEMKKVNYRYNKSFTSTYIDKYNKESIRTYDMYVRDIENNILAYFEPLEKLFTKAKVMHKYKIDELIIRKIDLFKAYDVIENDIRHNKAQSLYKIGGS